MNEDKENFNKDIWWKPGVQIFSEVSSWIAGPIILALIAGKALDKHYDTKPFWLLVFAGVSFLVSAYGIARTVKNFMQKLKEKIKEN